MTRLGLAGSLTVVLLASAAPALAAAGDDTEAEVMRDCGGSRLPRDQVSSCLERARVLDQSAPSPQLQSLEAQLEQRVRAGSSDDDAGPPPPPQRYGPDNGPSDNEMGPDVQGPPDEDSGPDDQGPPNQGYGPGDQGPPQGYGPDDRGPPPGAGPSDSDEPPVDDGEDGYDNSQPDPGYDQPDAPDDDMGPPPPDDDQDQG